MSTTGLEGSPSWSDGRLVRIPTGALSTPDYVLDLVDAARSVIAKAKVVWPKGAPQE